VTGWAVALPFVVSGLFWALAAPVGRRLPPATAVRALTAGALIAALATGLVLAAAAILLIGQAPAVAALGDWSGAALAREGGVPPAVGGLAALAVGVLALAAVHRAVRAGGEVLRAVRACRSMGPPVAGMVVVDDDAPEAYALPGIPGRALGRVVVSTAMVRALPAAERRVLLAHEAAHLRHRHHLYVQVAELAAAANPLLRPAARAVRRGVERWADEVAATQVGDRRLAARALARAGLARAAAGRALSVPVPALPGVEGDLVERTRALLAPPARRRPVLAAALAGLILLTCVATTVTAGGTEDRFEAAQTVLATHR
jgi:Zn-dependent protease with chaperone function